MTTSNHTELRQDMEEKLQERGCQHEVYKGLDGLLALRDDWDALFGRIEQPAYYQDWRWMHAVAKWLIKNEIFFLVGRKTGSVVLILPLQASDMDKGAVRLQTLRFPSHNHIVLTDLLCDTDRVDESDLTSVWTYLSGQSEYAWNYLEFSGFSANSQLSELMGSSETDLQQKSRSAYFRIRDGRFEDTLSKKFIKNIKRLAGRAEKEAGAIQVSFNSAADVLPDIFDKFLEIEASGWKGELGTSTAIKHHPSLVSFYRELMQSFSEDGSFAINLLEIGDVPAAAQLCIRCRAVWYILKIGYQEEMKCYGAGNILMLRFLQEASSDHVIEEVNLVTSPDWADRWHLESRPVYGYQRFNTNFKGQLAKLMLATKNSAKTILKKKGE